MARVGLFARNLRTTLLLTAIVSMPAALGAGVNQWTSIGPFGPGGNVRSLAVDGVSPGTIYAGTDGGVFKSVDGGASWGAMNAGLMGFTIYAISIDPQASGTVYAATSSGVFKTVNGGTEWSPSRTGIGNVAVTALAVDPADTRVLYAGTATGGVFRSADAGTTWTASSGGLANFEIRALACSPAQTNRVVYAGTAAGIFRSLDAGATWTSAVGFATPIRTLVVDPVSPSILYAGTDGLFSTSGVFKSSDSGTTWAPTNNGLGNVTVLSIAVCQTLTSTAFVGTQGGGVFVTRDAGATWHAIAGSPATVNTLVLDPNGPNVFAGSPQGFSSSSDEGMTWSARNVSFSTFAVSALIVDRTAPQVLYAAVARPGTTGGGVFKSTNSGGTWVPAGTGLPDRAVSALAMDANPPAAIYAGTAGAGVFKSRDGGATWASAGAGLSTPTINAMAVGAPGVVYAGTDSGVFRSADAGATWTASSSGLAVSSVQAIAVDPSAPNVVYAGTTGGVFKTVDGGQTWSASSSGLDNHGVLSLAIDPSTRDTLYAGTFSNVGSTLSGNGVYESHDGGATWSAANSGIEDLAVTSIATDASGASVFAGTTAGVFRSARGSATWTGVNDGLPGGLIEAVLVDRVSPSTVYAGTAANSAFRVVFAAGAGSCSAGPTTLCLNGNRFRVEVAWRAANLGTAGPGMAVPLTGDTGAFWFFTSANVELVVKVVDGRSVNGAFWTFYGAMSDVEYTITVTDSLTSRKKTYTNPQGQLVSVADTSAFPGPIVPGPASRVPTGAAPVPSVAASASAGPCTPDGASLCLNANRFRVRVQWFAASLGMSGQGQAAPLSADSGSFWFFSPGNLELNIKVVDGRAVNGRFWVFYGALSDVEYTITVTDMETGVERSYSNPQGRLASVADTSAF